MRTLERHTENDAATAPSIRRVGLNPKEQQISDETYTETAIGHTTCKASHTLRAIFKLVVDFGRTNCHLLLKRIRVGVRNRSGQVRSDQRQNLML